jgi:hypothetical protein
MLHSLRAFPLVDVCSFRRTSALRLSHVWNDWTLVGSSLEELRHIDTKHLLCSFVGVLEDFARVRSAVGRICSANAPIVTLERRANVRRLLDVLREDCGAVADIRLDIREATLPTFPLSLVKRHYLHQPLRADIASGLRIELSVFSQKHTDEHCGVEVLLRSLGNKRFRNALRSSGVLCVATEYLADPKHSHRVCCRIRSTRGHYRDAGKLEQSSRLRESWFLAVGCPNGAGDEDGAGNEDLRGSEENALAGPQRPTLPVSSTGGVLVSKGITSMFRRIRTSAARFTAPAITCPGGGHASASCSGRASRGFLEHAPLTAGSQPFPRALGHRSTVKGLHQW